MQAVNEAIELAISRKDGFSNKGSETIFATEIFKTYSNGGNCATFKLDDTILVSTSARQTSRLDCDYISFGERTVQLRIDGVIHQITYNVK